MYILGCNQFSTYSVTKIVTMVKYHGEKEVQNPLQAKKKQ